MKWFKHDAGAMMDAKLMKVRHKYGMQGYGLYWYCIELIAGEVSSKNITFELEHDAETIALEWGMDQLKVQEMMGYMVNLGLFEQLDSGKITCLKLAKRLDDTNAKNPEIRKILAKIYGENPIESESLGETPNLSGQIRLDKNIKDICAENPTPAPRSKFTPPTLAEVQAHWKAKGWTDSSPIAFFDYFSEGDWIDSKGKKVTAWKRNAVTWNTNKFGGTTKTTTKDVPRNLQHGIDYV